MWILKWLPDFVFHLIFIVGILGLAGSFVLGFVPFVSKYKLPIQVAASLLLVFGAYVEGGISDNNAWEARVSDLKLQVAKAEAATADANAKLTSALATHKAAIVAAQAATKQAIQENASSINKECKLNDISVQMYNQAVKGGAK